MSEYYFEYTCLSCNPERQRGQENKNQKNQDQKFVLFQDYEMGGSLCVQVLLDVPNMYKGVRLYHIENGIDVPKVFDEVIQTRSEFIPREKIIQNGGFYIRSNNSGAQGAYANLSGTGIFALVEDEYTLPTPSESYTYSINFGAKQEILYSIVEKKSKLIIDIVHPILSNDIKLRIFSAQGSKPLEKAYRENSSFQPIMLKAGVKNYLHVTRNTQNTTGFDFRLFFANEKDAQYYLLVDESLETLEEKIRREETREHDGDKKNKTKKHLTGRYYDDFGKYQAKKCPYCFNPIDLPKGYGKGAGYTICECSGKAGLTEEQKKQHVIFLERDEGLQKNLPYRHIICCGHDYRANNADIVDSTSNQPTSIGGLGHYRHLILPSDYMEKPSMNVTFVGATNSGKSVILSTLLGARSYLQEQMVTQGIKRSEAQTQETSYLLNSIVSRIDKKRGGNGVEMFQLDRIVPSEEKEDETNFTSLARSADKNKIEIDNITGRKKTQQLIASKYMVEVGRPLPQHTPESDMDVCGMHPFVFKMGSLGYGFFYDIPGESLSTTKETTNHLRGVKNADCLVLIINGYAKDYLKDSIREVRKCLEATALIKGKETLYNTPVAVVLAKFDMLKDVFDDNCHILRENILHLIDRDRGSKKLVYKNSEIQKHIAYSSYEIEHYLAAQGEGNFVNDMKKFNYLKYFAVSALGSDDCYTHDEKKILKFHERPLRLELPMIWLMYQMGLIKE